MPYDSIGTGLAGPSLAARLVQSGRTVAVIERGRYGGTCVNVGCIPTKTLVAGASHQATAASQHPARSRSATSRWRPTKSS